MKFWSKLAQVFFGVFTGYWIVQIMLIISTLSMVGLVGIGLSGGGGSIISLLISWGLFLIGLIISLAIGIISNMLLIAFLPVSGVTSSVISAMAVIYYALQLLLSFF